MKKYKINEMLEFELGTKFKSKTGDVVEVRYIGFDENKNKALWVEQCNGNGYFIPLTSEWLKYNFRLIEQQPVTWDEVMESHKKYKAHKGIVELLGKMKSI